MCGPIVLGKLMHGRQGNKVRLEQQRRVGDKSTAPQQQVKPLTASSNRNRQQLLLLIEQTAKEEG